MLQRARGFANLGEAAMLWGCYDDARRWLDAAAALAEAHQHVRLRDLLGATLAHLDWLTGSWTGPTELEAMALDADEPVLRADALLLAGLLDAAHGDHPRAQERVRAAIAVGRPRGPADGSRDPSAVLARLAIAAAAPGRHWPPPMQPGTSSRPRNSGSGLPRSPRCGSAPCSKTGVSGMPPARPRPSRRVRAV
ncbi:hypothetical protein ACFQ51_46790 [Streptomyces kaempferi]